MILKTFLALTLTFFIVSCSSLSNSKSSERSVASHGHYQCATTRSQGEAAGYYHIDVRRSTIEFFSSGGSIPNGLSEAKIDVRDDGLHAIYFREVGEERFIIIGNTSDDHILGNFPNGYPMGGKLSFSTIAKFGKKIENLGCTYEN